MDSMQGNVVNGASGFSFSGTLSAYVVVIKTTFIRALLILCDLQYLCKKMSTEFV